MAIDPDKREYQHLLPPGRHRMSLADLGRICVDRFSTSAKRPRLMEVLSNLVHYLRETVGACDIWVDGSFVTEKDDPDDIDLTIVVHGDVFDAIGRSDPDVAEDLQAMAEDGRFSPELDIYLIFVRPKDHPEHEVSEDAVNYWAKWWSVTRETGSKVSRWSTWEKAMSRYAFSLERAREAAALVSKLEGRLSLNPKDASLRIMLSSAVRMAQRTEEELYAIASDEAVDLCRYRLVKKIGSGFGVQSVSKSLEHFQEAVSFIYEALLGRPKARANLSAEARRDTEMLFGYSFAGSLGVVLVAPSERGFFFTRFDEVVKTIGQVFELDNHDEIRDMAKKIGTAAVNKIYDWAIVNTKANFDLDLRWTNSNSVESGRYVEAGQFQKLANLISLTSATEDVPLHKTGVLVGFDSVMKTFHLVEPDGDSYKGHLHKDFPLYRDWTINKTYSAAMIEEVTTKFSTGVETSRYVLTQLVPQPQQA